ncbi:ubiquinol-cytochrome c reductase iron-sulfur subunit [Ilumatobacter sp.]|uniref:ubiquinol-cytochrome c reductase iron-sulfur subunit n=1 Tax=Ilumatobacter sp. TaxID=1967498 RepID=UPI003AF49BB6
MRRFGRRRFLEASVAAVCVGCASNDAPTLRPPSTGSLPAGASDAVLPGRDTSVEVGTLDEVRSEAADVPLYVPEAKAWLVVLDDDEAASLAEVADLALRPGLEHGLLALYEKCPHLGCRVPYCESSAWFECACHGAHFTRAGELRAGPGPRGLDPLPVLIDGDLVAIGVAERIEGAPAGTVVIEQPAAGPHCFDPGSA